MFDALSERLSGVIDGLTGRGALSEKDVDAALREIREEGGFAHEGPAREPFRSLVRFMYRKPDQPETRNA